MGSMYYAKFYSLKYISLDDALRLTSQLEPEKQHTYKMVQVHPNDQYLMAISWEGPNGHLMGGAHRC